MEESADEAGCLSPRCTCDEAFCLMLSVITLWTIGKKDVGMKELRCVLKSGTQRDDIREIGLRVHIHYGSTMLAESSK